MDMYNALHATMHAAREYLSAPATKSQFLEKGMLTVSVRGHLVSLITVSMTS